MNKVRPFPEPPEISFLIPCYQCRRTLGFTLQAIFRQKTEYAYEVLVIDSTPQGVSDWIKSKYKGAKVIHSETRLSAGAARNLGAREARGLFLAFIDADVSPAEGWLQSCRDSLKARPGIAVVGGSVQNGNPGFPASRLQYWIEFSEFLPGSPSGLRAFLSSSNMLVPRQAFLEAGGFDENFVMAEDLLFCRRFAGRVFFDSKAAVSHLHRTRWTQVVAHLGRLGYWSGRLRAVHDFPGSWIRRLPALALLLPISRAFRIGLRVWRSDPLQGLLLGLYLPLLLLALGSWANGFRRGLQSRQSPDGEPPPAEPV